MRTELAEFFVRGERVSLKRKRGNAIGFQTRTPNRSKVAVVPRGPGAAFAPPTSSHDNCFPLLGSVRSFFFSMRFTRPKLTAYLILLFLLLFVRSSIVGTFDAARRFADKYTSFVSRCLAASSPLLPVPRLLSTVLTNLAGRSCGVTRHRRDREYDFGDSTVKRRR